MLMQSLNELNIRLMLTTVSPLLVREGRYSPEVRERWSDGDTELKKRMPNAIPISSAPEETIRSAVRDRDPVTAVGRLPFFIPGTSMRGAWRGNLERILRARDAPNAARVCDPLDDDPDEKASPYRACSAVLTEEQAHRTFIPYRLSCPVCKLFGSTTQASRLSISDGGLMNGAERLVVSREHVRIDRKSGRVAPGALIKYFGLQGAKFRVDVRLRNFELQHIRLIGELLKDVAIGLVPLGSGKNKGYGQVKGKLEEIRFTQFGLSQPGGSLLGVAEHPDPAMAKWFKDRYGVEATAAPLRLPPGEWTAETPWRFERCLTEEQFEALWQQAPRPWDTVPLLKARTV
jgi:CRISPR/Cas system CSM-associated protein Csm3 (group 7 of RAMP superfamily)